jgi:hypothetical protein
MQKKTTLPSGHDLVINHVSFAAASALRRAIARELLKVNVQFSESIIPALLTRDVNNITASLSGTEVNTLKEVLLVLLASEELEGLVLDCCKKWVLAGRPVTNEVFEDDELRGDLIPLSVEVAREALLPFFSNLGLPSSTPEKKKDENPK